MVKVAAVDGAFKSVTDERIPRVALLNDVRANIYEIGLSLRNMVIMADPADVKKQVDNVQPSAKRSVSCCKNCKPTSRRKKARP